MIACASTVGNGIRVVRPDGTLVVRSFPAHHELGPGWSPDSRLIVASSGGRLDLLDVSTGSTVPLSTAGVYPSWTP